MFPTSSGFYIGPLYIHMYGVLIATGILLAVLLATRREAKLGLPKDAALDVALAGVPCAIVGARLYYVAFSWSEYAQDPIRILYIRQGGLAIYGGVIGGLLGSFIYARVKKVDFLKLCDLAAPSFALGQAVGRWGNFFNQEAYGVAATAPWQMRFPVSVFIEADGLWHLATFFYESVWCLLIAVVLLLLERRGFFKRRGEMFCLYVLMYALERTVVEGLRTDSLYLGPVRVSQALSMLAAVTALGVFILRRRHTDV